MQRDELAAEEVLARRNALGDGDGLHALVGDEAVDAPFGAVEGVLVDLDYIFISVPCSRLRTHRICISYLEPSTTNTAITRRVRHLLQVGHDGALVARVNDVAGSGCECVSPCQGSGRSSLEGDDRAGLCGGVGSTIADDVVGRDIVDRSVVAGYTYAVAHLAIVDGNEDGVGGCRGGKEEGS